MDISARQPCLHLHSRTFAVLHLEGEEALSEIPRFSLDILVGSDFSLRDSLAASAQLDLKGKDGVLRQVAGVLTSLEHLAERPDGRRRVRVILESRLALLRQNEDTRLLLGLSVPDIVRTLLEAHGFTPGQLHFHLSADYPVRPWTLQGQESDFTFLQRLLARAGIFYWSDCLEGQEVLHFSDHNGHCLELDRGMLRYQPRGGLESSWGGQAMALFDQLAVGQRLGADEIQVVDRIEEAPASTLAAEARTAGEGSPRRTPIRQTHFEGAGPLPQVQRQARIRAEAESTSARRIVARGDVADLSPGYIFQLDASLLSPSFSGEYLITRLRHRAAFASGQGEGSGELEYRCEARLHPRDLPFRSPLPPRPEIPSTFTARIESDGPYAHLDEQGRYRLRALFDLGTQPHGEASPPIRRLSPYGGPPGDRASGFHAPLLDGAEVLLSCLNGDPDRPVIVGNLPNPATPSVVTSANCSINRWRSAGGNELSMDDAVDQEVLRLRTVDDLNLLELNAAALGHRVRLASVQGALTMQAKQTLTTRSGDTLTENVGGDRIQMVENRHCTTTRQAEIHHQAKTDIRYSGGKNLKMSSGKNIEMTSARRLRIEAQRGQKITVRGSEAIFSVQDGNLHIQAANEIRIVGEGGGDITFAQGGGGFVVKPDGCVQLFGNTVALKGDAVELNGTVNWEVASPSPMPSLSGVEALLPQAIPVLQSAGASQILDLAWSRSRILVDERVEACFSVRNFQGGESVEIVVFETDQDGGKREVDRLSCVLDDGCGHYRIPWVRSAQDAEGDLTMDQTAGDRTPLTYIFQVVIEGLQSDPSAGLNLLAEFTVNAVDQTGNPLQDGVELRLTDAEGRLHYSQVQEGQALFEKILLGPWQLHGADNLLIQRDDEI